MRSQNIAWVGTAINLLDVASIGDSLIDRAQTGKSKVEIYLANPYSRLEAVLKVAAIGQVVVKVEV